MSTSPTWDTLSPPLSGALRIAANRLTDEFTGVFGVQTIERYLHSSMDEFAPQAAIAKFLPLMAERFARQRLRALAIADGLVFEQRPVVLFLCVQNAGRSQMALGLLRQLVGDQAVLWSGGAVPATSIDPAVVVAMSEVGIDLSEEFPKPWTDETVRAADVVVTMGCGDACPVLPGKRYEDWAIEDPAGLTPEQVRPIRDEISRRVRALADSLALAPTGR